MSLDLDQEWCPVVGYEGLYSVNRDGCVVSLRNGFVMRPRPKTIGGTSRVPYLHLRLSRGGKCRQVYLHRIIAEAFIGPCPTGMECRHLNGNPLDNRVENLAWGTRVENSLDRKRHGTSASIFGEKNPKCKLSEKCVREIMRSRLPSWFLAQETGVCKRHIEQIRAGHRWLNLLRAEAAQPGAQPSTEKGSDP